MPMLTNRSANQIVFVGVTDPIDPRVETAEQVRDRILLASEYIRTASLGSTADCGFAPFADDASTSRDIAFAKIRARIAGTAMAGQVEQGVITEKHNDTRTEWL